MVASRQIAAWALALALCAPAGAQTIGSGTTVRKHREVETPHITRGVFEAEAAIDAKNYASAESLLKEAVKIDPDDSRAWYDLGYVYTLTDRNAEAIAAYRHSVDANPNIFEPNLNLGLALAAAGDPEAAKFLKAATALKPESHPEQGLYRAWFALARVLEKQDPAGAIAAYRDAEKLQPKAAEPHLYAGTLLAKQHDSAGAEEEFQKAVGLDPKDSEPVAQLANLYMEEKRLDQAEATLRKYLELDPKSATAHLQLGRVLAAEGKSDAAASEYQAALLIAPQDPDVHHEIAEMYLQAGKYKEAAAEFNALLQQSPDNAEMWAEYGGALLRAKDFVNAQNALVKAVNLKLNQPQALADLAMAASENKQYDVTLKALNARAKFADETPMTWFLRATAFDHLRDFKNASECYRQFLAASNGKYPDQEWQAKHRLIAIDPKSRK